MTKEIPFGEWLRKQRRSMDLTRQTLSTQVGCAEITLRRIENGTLKPSKELAFILLEKLGIPELERPQWISFARGISSLPKKSIDSSANKPVTNLPASLTTFIGREKEQTEVIKLVRKYRLITLTGPGGVGKTRLSVKVGEQMLGDFAHGVWLIELASLNDPLLLPQAVVAVFGITTQSNTALTELLINFLRGKSILLILDNCEHLLGACAHLTDTLLKNCPNLKILATSRESLSITGEVAYLMPSLGLPDLKQLLEDFKKYESVRLFEERAQLANTDFSLTIDNASSIAQICHLLDGIPLALELAAAHVNMFSTEQIAAQLNESFNLLIGGSRTALPRQQTIRASIEWSWNLLSDSERILLQRLSVFASGWILESAESVCSENGIEKKQVMDLMTQLVAKSLVVANQVSGGQRRYHLLETIRQYANEKLVESGENKNISSQHLKYFLQLSEVAEVMWIGPEQVEWYARMDDERNNLRAALDFASKNHNLEAGMLIYSALKNLWLNWDLNEGISRGKDFLQEAQSYDYPRARAKALYIYGQLLTRVDQIDDAYTAGQECLALARACGDQYVEVNGLLLLGWVMVLLRNPSRQMQQMEYAQKALALSRSIGDIWGEARALSSLGWAEQEHNQIRIYWNEAEELTRQIGNWYGLSEHLSDFGNFELLDGNLEIAQKKLDEAILLNKKLNSRKKMEAALQTLGRIELIRGDFNQARIKFQTNLVTAEERGSRLNYLWSKCFLGYVALQEGNFHEAQDIFIECVQEFRKDKTSIGTVFTLERMASLFNEANKLNQAARLIGCADVTREEIGDKRPRIEQDDVDRDVTAIVAKIGPSAFEVAYNQGRGMTLDEAVAYALEES